MKRHINWKNLGWLVSTLMFYGIAIPFLSWFAYQLIHNGIVVNNIPMLIISAISIIWYDYRNSPYGYGNYFREWVMAQDDKKWQTEMRAKRERQCIEHHIRNNNGYDRIAK